METIHSRFKYALDYLKKTQQIKQKDWAGIAGTSPQNINHMVAGKVVPSSALLDVLQDQYGISRKWILKGEGLAPGQPENKKATPEQEPPTEWMAKYYASIEEQNRILKDQGEERKLLRESHEMIRELHNDLTSSLGRTQELLDTEIAAREVVTRVVFGKLAELSRGKYSYEDLAKEVLTKAGVGDQGLHLVGTGG